MEKFVTIETSRLAKQKGFNLQTYEYFIGEVPVSSVPQKSNHNKDSSLSPLEYTTRPTQSVLQTWLRDNYQIHVIMKPVLGSKNGYDSYPLIGWNYDIIMNNKEINNSYYMGYPIGEWFTAVIDNEDETLENIRVFEKYENALEDGLFNGLKQIRLNK